MIFKWVFKSAAAILLVTNTWNIVMGVFDMAQSVVAQASGIISSDAAIDISSVLTDMEPRLMEMDLGPLFGLWFQSMFMHSIKHNRLEAAVLFAIQQQVHLAVSYSELVARINSAPIKKSQSFRLDDLITTKERELAKVTRYKQSIYQDWKDGEITQQEYRTMKADYEQQSQRLSDILARLTAERAELANGVDQEHPALVAFMKFENIDGLSREILIELIDHIKVYENGNISVRFKFADELRKIAEYIEINTTTDPAVAG